ncbi:MAG: SLC13 family permease [Bacteroidota bacterium]
MISSSVEPLLVLVLTTLTFFLIYRELVKPSLGLLGLIITFLVLKIIDPEEVLSGFSNQSIASIFLLILITAGIRKNFNTEVWLDKLFARKISYRSFLFRMMTSVGLVSSFINNTPVVALMTPYVVNWGKKNSIAPSKLLIPLSFSTLLGGMITIIGTSTTLVLNGFLQEEKLSGIPSFDLLVIGLIVFSAGILFLGTLGTRLLPEHKDSTQQFEQNPADYLTEIVVTPEGRLEGQSIQNAGLRQLQDAYIVELVRGSEVIAPVKPESILKGGDVLILAGNSTKAVELTSSNAGLEFPKQVNKVNKGNIQVIEVVISNSSSLINKKIKESDFRNRYNAAIVSMSRNGEQLRGKIGDITIKAGDSLLLFAGDEFQTRAELYRDLYVITKINEWGNPSRQKSASLIIVTLLSLSLLVMGYFPLFTSLIIIFAVMASLKLITLQDVKRELDFNLLATLALSLVLGHAILVSGAADLITGKIIAICEPYGNRSLLAGILIMTALLSTFVTNVGAVSISFPIVYSLSNTMGIDGTAFYMAIAFASSAAFATPVSYQTNLMIYGPGGYTFKDFARIGVPMIAVYLVTVYFALINIYSL